MANFEALIRGALSSQDAGNAQVRAKVYQSSRNALHRMITENRSFTVEAAIAQQQDLENAISKIEAEFHAPPPTPIRPEPEISEEPLFVEEPLAIQQPQPATPPPAQPVQTAQAAPMPEPASMPEQAIEPPVQDDDPLAELKAILADGEEPLAPPVQTQENFEPVIAPQAVDAHTEPELVPPPVPEHVDTYDGADPLEEYYTEERQPPLGFAKRRKTQRRFTGLVIFLLIVALLAYLAYVIFTSFMESGLIGDNDNQNILSRQEDRADFITVLEASDPSSLIVANRGSAEIVNQQNSQMIRIFSTRSQQTRDQSAEPILLRFPPGVVEQISNKQITVEIFAKSGTSSPAQFTVECRFEGVGDCGRKRFRIGLQPEVSVFAANIGNITNPNQGMYLAINTDTTSSAAITGKGDVIDIAYVRIRAN